MPKRRRSRQSEEGGALEEVLDFAWAHPVPGLILCAVMLPVGLWLWSMPFDLKSMNWRIVLPILGIALTFIGGFGLLVSIVGVIRDLIRGR